MSELGDDFREYRAMRKEKKERNVAQSVELLDQNGIPYIMHQGNNKHLLVAGRLNYWPSTGLWIDRITKRKGRGVVNLMRFLDLVRKGVNAPKQ